MFRPKSLMPHAGRAACHGPVGGARWVPLDGRAHGRRACGRERGERRNRPRSRDSDRRACTAGCAWRPSPDLVERALMPIIENATRFARDHVDISIRTDVDQVVFEVHDDGPGVEPTIREQIFEPGVSKGGNGLGLRAQDPGPTTGPQAGPRRRRRYGPRHNRRRCDICPAPPPSPETIRPPAAIAAAPSGRSALRNSGSAHRIAPLRRANDRGDRRRRAGRG